MVWVRTSWGPVWWCFASQVNSQTPIDGTGCGYAHTHGANGVRIIGRSGAYLKTH